MNQVSWLIYWGGVLPHFGFFFIVCGLMVIITVIFMWIVTGAMLEEARYENDLKKDVIWGRCRRWTCGAIPLILCFWCMAAFMPSQDTMYAIAASQVGDDVLHSKTVSLAEQALDAWLERQIHPTPPPADTSK